MAKTTLDLALHNMLARFRGEIALISDQEERLYKFSECAREVSSFIFKMGRADVSAKLTNFAQEAGLDDIDVIQREIAHAFEAREKENKSNGAAHTESQTPTQPLPFIDISKWRVDNAPVREWSVLNRIPLRQPTLYSGEGAVGKSLTELQLCAAHVLGRDWLGALPEPGPAIYFGAEDEADELHRRLADIVRHYGVEFSDLVRGGLHLLSFAGEDPLLGIPDRTERIVPTKLYERLLEAVQDIKPKHIGIDTSADVYGGNENNRTQVRQFVSLLRKLAIKANGAVVLLSHPSLIGIQSGSGLSGSTGWHNSVRARMYLRSARPVEDEQPDNDLREIEFKKNNYGPKGENVVLRYQNGVFVPEQAMSSFEKAIREQQIEDVFLKLLRKMNDQQRMVSHSATSAKNYAPLVFAEMPEGKPYTKKEFAAAMERLFDRRAIHVENYGRPSRPNQRLIVGPP